MRALWTMGVVLVGCSEDADRASSPEAWDRALALGSGDAAYEPLAEGDPIAFWRGQQGGGGYHLNVGGEVTGMSPEVAVSPRVTLLATGEVLASEQPPAYMGLAAFDEAACTGSFWGVRAYLDDAGPDADRAGWICSLEGEAIELSVEVRNLTTEEVVEASVDLVVTLDDTALAYCP
jgi:hypothetical protein